MSTLHVVFVVGRDQFLFLFTDRLNARVRRSQFDVADSIENLHHLFLVNHHAVGFFQNLLHHVVQVLRLAPLMLDVDVLLNHPAFQRTGTIQRGSRDDVAEVIRLHLGKQISNTAGLQLENAFGLTALKQLESRLVFQREVKNINSLARRLFDQVDRVTQNGQRLQTKEIHLQQPGRLDIVHRPLSNHILFARHAPQRHVVGQRPVTDHDRRRVRSDVTRKTFQLFRKVQQLGDFRITFVNASQFLTGFDRFLKRDPQLVGHHASDLVNTRKRNPQRAADVLDRRTSLHRAEGANLCDAFLAVFLLNVLHDVGTTFLAEVDIDIRSLQTIFV